ncbi:MAG: ABC transporter permease [Deltaproteobacteria bacterium RBG_13_52_11]|nr:MAG: ABC transporter permease [Deltaproteobacteria bacterium RBG_13_52_11]
MWKASKAINVLGEAVAGYVREMGRMFLLLLDTIRWSFSPPFRLDLFFQQMDRVGVRSGLVVVLTGAFSGMVLALQGFHATRQFGAETMVGVAVALSMTRELGPVLTSFMVTGRAGSAMAAEIGTMRVTEQIDALSAMAVNPIKYLIVPRVLASIVVLPLLTVIADFIGILGGYFMGVTILGISAGAYVANMERYVKLDDIYHGLIKAAVFGLILSAIGCYKGYTTTGGAEGVGKATTESVVLAAVAILMANYFLTAAMF